MIPLYFPYAQAYSPPSQTAATTSLQFSHLRPDIRVYYPKHRPSMPISQSLVPLSPTPTYLILPSHQAYQIPSLQSEVYKSLSYQSLTAHNPCLASSSTPQSPSALPYLPTYQSHHLPHILPPQPQVSCALPLSA